MAFGSFYGAIEDRVDSKVLLQNSKVNIFEAEAYRRSRIYQN